MKLFFYRLWFELTTPRLRPRYQDRYMYPGHSKDDRKYLRLREQQFDNWCQG